jgi:hypothetical protein
MPLPVSQVHQTPADGGMFANPAAENKRNKEMLSSKIPVIK